MKLQNRFSKLIATTLAVAAIAVVGYITTAEAQNVRVYSGSALVGFIPDQSLRCSMAYPLGVEEGTGPVRVTTYTYDSIGNLVHQTAPVALDRDQFHTFIIDWKDLRMEGEEVTGRKQVRVEFQFQMMASEPLIPSENFQVSLETVDKRSGTSSPGTYYTGTVSVSGDGF